MLAVSFRVLFFVFLALPAMGAHVIFNLADFGLDTAAHSNRITRLVPLSTPRTNDGNLIITSEVRTYTNSTSSVFLATNLVAGTYRVEIPGRWSTTTFNILVPDNSTTTNAVNLITTTNSAPNATVGYTQSQADARFLQQISGVSILTTNKSFPDTGGTNTLTLWTIPVPTGAGELLRVTAIAHDADTVVSAAFDVSWVAINDNGSMGTMAHTTNLFWNGGGVGRLHLLTSGTNVIVQMVNQSPATVRSRIEVIRTP